MTTTKKVKKHAGGRPTIIKDSILQKLEYVFAIGGSDKEACFYANISNQTLYNYQSKNPKFIERKEALKNSPTLKARETVVASLETTRDAQWYLERKEKSEFSTQTEQKTTTLELKGDIKDFAKLMGITTNLNEEQRKALIRPDQSSSRLVTDSMDNKAQDKSRERKTS